MFPFAVYQLATFNLDNILVRRSKLSIGLFLLLLLAFTTYFC
jgi:hypothetical protein